MYVRVQKKKERITKQTVMKDYKNEKDKYGRKEIGNRRKEQDK